MKKVGVLIYDDSLMGGAERVGLNLAEELSKKHDVHVISLFNEKKESYFKIDTRAFKHYIIREKTCSITLNLISLSNDLRKYIKKNKIEVILLITAGVNSIGILATVGTKAKTIYCEHSNLENKVYGKKHVLRQWLGAKLCNKIVTLTERDKENFHRLFKVPYSKLLSIPNWCEVKNIGNKLYDFRNKNLITVGRLTKVKGYDMLISIASKIDEYDKMLDWKWDIYGDGEYREVIEKMIVDFGMQKRIFLKGATKDIMNIYSNYGIYVLTSYYEGFPMVLLEAQSCNLPIVAFDCATGPSDIIENDVNGYLVRCYSIDDMADRIYNLMNYNSLKEKFSKNSRKNILNFDKDTICAKWENLIETI